MLDFQKRKKKYFDVVLHDGTKLKIPAPTMAVYSAMKEIADDQENVGEEELAGLLRDILNNNKQKVKVSQEQLQDFDLDDMKELFVEYTQFVIKELSDPS